MRLLFSAINAIFMRYTAFFWRYSRRALGHITNFTSLILCIIYDVSNKFKFSIL